MPAEEATEYDRRAKHKEHTRDLVGNKDGHGAQTELVRAGGKIGDYAVIELDKRDRGADFFLRQELLDQIGQLMPQPAKQEEKNDM